MAGGVAATAAVLGAALVTSALAAAERPPDPPRPPCEGAAPFPPYAAAGSPPEVAVWTTRDLGASGLPNVRVLAGLAAEGATPPPCSGWSDAAPFTLALAARVPDPGGADAILRRLGAASEFGGLRYWSATRSRWEPLFDDAPYAVAGPADQDRRPDHGPAELASGADTYVHQNPAGPVGGAVYRTRVREAGPDRIVAESENATTARAAGLFPLRPGTLRLVHYFDRLPDGSGWGYYGLVGVATDPGSARTYVNRAAALFRHLAGLPGEGEPPLWP